MRNVRRGQTRRKRRRLIEFSDKTQLFSPAPWEKNKLARGLKPFFNFRPIDSAGGESDGADS